MLQEITKIFMLKLIITLQCIVYAQENETTEYCNLFYHIDDHFINSFANDYGLYHLSAIAGSYGMIETGFDWEVHEFARKNQWIPRTGFASVVAGGLIPLVVPAGLFIYGKFQEDNDFVVSSLALGQSVILSYLVVSGFKAITGRKGPDILDEEENPVEDYSKDFKFGFFERGVFDGWPSGHTTTAFAMAFTLVELFPENKTLSTTSLVYASLIGLGISVNIHWFSDFFAGALIGYTIGKSVGTGFRSLLGGKKSSSNFSFSVLPGYVSVQYRF
jgi:membrane-associated phospholipid phosphatase